MELAPSPVPPVDRWAERPPGQSHGQQTLLTLEQLLTMETKLRRWSWRAHP